MTDLKTKINEDLFYLNLNASEEDIIIKANRKQTKRYTYRALIAAALVIAIIAGTAYCLNNLDTFSVPNSVGTPATAIFF